jgi:hypothetical protein
MDLKNELVIFKNTTFNMIKNMNESVKRIGQVPVLRAAHAARQATRATAEAPMEVDVNVTNDNVVNQETVAPPAGTVPYECTLTKCPRTLFVLWNEWEFGIGGRKPAKLFNSTERGRVKFGYSLRKPFWLLVSNMVRAGYTSGTAIDKIYSVYSGMNTTKILQQIRKDAKTGGNPQLRV